MFTVGVNQGEEAKYRCFYKHLESFSNALNKLLRYLRIPLFWATRHSGASIIDVRNTAILKDECTVQHLRRRISLVPVRILIVDDNAVVRRQIRSLLESHSDWQVCGEAINGGEAIQQARELRPDLVIMDFSMPIMNGLRAAQEISKDIPDVPLLLFSVFMSNQLVLEAKRSGFRGVVPKEEVGHLTTGVETLLHHGTYFPGYSEN
jgi:CheY-like chemotaxis protein